MTDWKEVLRYALYLAADRLDCQRNIYNLAGKDQETAYEGMLVLLADMGIEVEINDDCHVLKIDDLKVDAEN